MSLPAPITGLTPGVGALRDRFGRVHDYLRVSVTDRCNYRCTYCMPAEGLSWLPREHLLTDDEIVRLVAVFATLGVRRVRLTGGEPTVRRELPALVARVASTPGIDDVAMTTNGHVFARMAPALADAGLKRVNISLDTLDPAGFRAVTRGGDLARVLAAVDAARACGLTPVKINCVVVAGVNEHEVERLVAWAAPHAATTQLRFIEAMPFVATGGERQHVSAAALRARLAAGRSLLPVDAPQGGGPATHVRLADSGLLVGFISPITEHFCQACNRLRLQADGHLRTCLSRDAAPSLRDVMRAGATDEELVEELRARVWAKVAGHEADINAENYRPFDGVMTSVGG